MPGVHDFACYIKRGYGRASFHASGDVRSGLLTRDEAFENFVPLDQIVPNALSYYTSITGINREEFIKTLQSHKHASLIGIPLPITENLNAKTPTLFIDDLKKWIESSE